MIISKLLSSFPKHGINFTKRTFQLHELPYEHKILQTVCHEFAVKELQPVAGILDKNKKFPNEQIAKISEMGLLGVCVDNEFGGCGMDILALSVAVEQLSRSCASTGSIVSIHNCLYANLLQRKGTQAQKEEFLGPFVKKGILGVFALSESDAGSDVGSMTTTAIKNGNDWILNGTKAWVTSGHEAKAGIFFATIDKSKKHKGISAFIIPFDTPGLTLGPKEDKLGIRATSTCSIVLENVKVPDTNILGNVGEGFKIAMEQLDQARIGIASQALGIAQAALDTAVLYASQRIAFGQPIIKLPTIQTKLADMALRLESARLLVWKSAALHGQSKPSTMFSSMGKLAASECATFNAHNCIQILGGMGYVTNMPAERFYRDAKITEIYGGISDIQKLVIAEQLMKQYEISLK